MWASMKALPPGQGLGVCHGAPCRGFISEPLLGTPLDMSTSRGGDGELGDPQPGAHSPSLCTGTTGERRRLVRRVRTGTHSGLSCMQKVSAKEILSSAHFLF